MPLDVLVSAAPIPRAMMIFLFHGMSLDGRVLLRLTLTFLGMPSSLRPMTDSQLLTDVKELYNNENEGKELSKYVTLATLEIGAKLVEDPLDVDVARNDYERAAIDNEKDMGLWEQTIELKTTILITACSAVTQ